MNKSIQISYREVSIEELNTVDQNLIQDALETMKHAHAPYSQFKVGSAVRLDDGSVVTGSNQENAAYPAGLCAERVALFAAKSQSDKSVDAIAVVARNKSDKPANAFSCGSCRQVIMEYANLQDHPIKILMQTAEGTIVVLEDSKELLPFRFNSDSLQ
jgi:cytidine deaminase